MPHTFGYAIKQAANAYLRSEAGSGRNSGLGFRKETEPSRESARKLRAFPANQTLQTLLAAASASLFLCNTI